MTCPWFIFFLRINRQVQLPKGDPTPRIYETPMYV